MDIKPYKRPTPPKPPVPTAPERIVKPVLDPIAEAPTGIAIEPKRSWKKIVIWCLIGLAAVLVGLIIAALIWYRVMLSPIGDDPNEHVKLSIKEMSTPDEIGDLLEEKGVIRSSLAFTIHTRLTGTQDSLQAGGYRLSPAESTPEIVDHLTNGNTDNFDITFLPGATLEDNRDVFLAAGYSAKEVDAALKADYTSPLFAGRPEGADLEGYIYGETYKFDSDATVGGILEYIFAYYYDVIKENDLVAKYQAQDLNLYEGITLASIIQREAIGGDEAQIAEVFYNRLSIGMVLGSDVTYQYIADKTGVARDPNLDSPYNTRRYPGLPPGPIATPGLAALKAAANPAEGDYLFFLSGDDNVTYFGRTNAEHEANITNHCQTKCKIL